MDKNYTFSKKILGCKIEYFDSRNDKEILIILHGWSHSKELWESVYNYFCHDFRVVILDLPGFGNSEKNIINCSYDFYLSILKEFINEISIMPNQKIDLLGHSFGGILGIKLSRLIELNSLILISTPIYPIWPASIASRCGVISKLMYSFSVKSDFLSKFAASFTVLDKKSIPLEMIIAARNAEPASALATLNLMSNIDLSEELNSIKIPLLIIIGDKDRIVLNQYKNLNQFKILKYKNCGHSPFIEKEAEFLDDLTSFFIANNRQ